MRKSLKTLLISILLLSGCTSNVISSSNQISSSSSIESQSSSNSSSYSESSSMSSSISSEEPVIDYSILSGNFINKADSIISSDYNSLLILNESLGNGSFTATISINDAFSNNGIAFDIDNEANIYYVFGINIAKELYVNKYDNGNYENIISYKGYSLEKETKLTIYRNIDKNIMQLYVDNNYLDTFELNILGSSSCGLYAGGMETIYSDISLVNDINIIDNNENSYEVRNGYFEEYDENRLVSLSDNSIFVHKSKTLSNGEIEATIKLNGKPSDNGFIFGLSENDQTFYWEAKVSYYFFFTSRDSYCYLGKVNNGSWNLLQIKTIKGFDHAGQYRLKVVKNENNIYCYIDDILYFVYTDKNPLPGVGVGLRAGSDNIIYDNIIINNTDNLTADCKDYDIYHGSFKQIGDAIVSNDNNSIAINKSKKLFNGTITTSFAPNNSQDDGIIFRVSKPDIPQFYEEEQGLSYYWLYFARTGKVCFARYENGVVIKQMEKYIPAGSAASAGYQVKIILDNQNVYCYFDGRLAFTYHDENYLKGDLIGIKANGKESVFNAFKLSDNQTKETNEVLIFGHSYTDFWHTYKQDFPNYKDINNIGIGGTIAYHWQKEYINEVIEYQPNLGIYWIGINDLSGNIAPITVYEQVKDTLTTIKKALPEFKVILLGVNQCPARTNIISQISQTNIYYAQLEEEFDWISYVNVEYLYCDSNNKPISVYFTDGLHLTHEAYLMAVSEINKKLAEK